MKQRAGCKKAIAGLLVVFGLAAGRVAAQGYAPEEAPRHMTLAPGFEVTLVASEPMVCQPVTIEFDDRGRLWVIQYLQYPNPAGLERVKVDRYSRTVYDRIPKPPPGGPNGADRITILEDTDGDGRADEARDFVHGLNLASGLAFGFGGVYVLNVPYLLFYPDHDRDDVPDSDPQVLLTGFGMEDAHSVANSLAWGPDGWLYGCQGSTVTANVRGSEFQQGVWRYHPVTREFELFCEGGGNSWGLDFDRSGNLFYSTNHGGFCMLHGVQGGYYWKNFGKHGALHNPYSYGYFEHVPHTGFRGGHVTVGGIVYQGAAFPEEFRGKYIAADLLGHALYWHSIAERGSTFQSSHGGELLLAEDTWFAPSDLTVGPDGAVYVADWHDQRTAHPDPDAQWDRTNGRIYRIRRKGAAAATVIDPHDLPSDRLVAMLGSANDWYVRRARRILAERRDPAVIPALRQAAAAGQDQGTALQALWAVYAGGGFDEPLAGRLLESPHEAVRSWTVRLLGDMPELSGDLARRLDLVAETDPSAAVRSQLASTARRLPAEQALPIVNSILLRGEDSQDPFIPLLLWWAIERHAIAAADQVLARYAAPSAWDAPLTRDVILGRLMRRYAAEGTEQGFAACARLLAAAPATEGRRMLIAALDQGLRDGKADPDQARGALFAEFAVGQSAPASGRGSQTTPVRAVERLVRQIWEDGTADAAVIRAAARLGSPAATKRALVLAPDPRVPVDTRVAMLEVLGETGREDSVDTVLGLLAANEPEALQVAALVALERFDRQVIASFLLKQYGNLSGPVRSRARELLFSRRAWALAFLLAVERGEYDAQEVPLDQLRRIALHQDRQLNALVRQHWGNIQPGTPEEKLAEIRRLANDLRAGSGDLARGKELFKKHCAICHVLFGDGGRIGPELTSTNRRDRDYLLASMVDPSALVRKEYLGYVVHTTDGRVLAGLLVEQTPASLTLLGATNERTTIARADIDQIQESAVSIMPEKILAQLQPQELRDLFAYLQSP